MEAHSEWLVHSFPENQILTFLGRIGDQEQARTVADRFASTVVSTRRQVVALVAAKFRTWGTRSASYRLEDFRNFHISRKKDNLERLTETLSRSILNWNFLKLWHSRPQSLRSHWPAAWIERLWEQPFRACAIDEDLVKPDNQNSVISHCYFKMHAPRAFDSCRRPEGSYALGTRLKLW